MKRIRYWFIARRRRRYINDFLQMMEAIDHYRHEGFSKPYDWDR